VEPIDLQSGPSSMTRTNRVLAPTSAGVMGSIVVGGSDAERIVMECLGEKRVIHLELLTILPRKRVENLPRSMYDDQPDPVSHRGSLNVG
jgi:hypothetical protein